MKRSGIKILIGLYVFLGILIEGIVLTDAATSKTWKPFIQTTIIIVLFSVIFLSGIILIGRREIVDCRVENGGVIKLFPMIGKMICVDRDNIAECNEYIHMFTVVLNINKKRKHFRLSKRYFLKIPWEQIV